MKNGHEFEPTIHARPIAPDVERARKAWERRSPTETTLELSIDGNIQACRLALDALAEFHRELVEKSDLDLEADTRWVAIWESTGRCISLGNALLDQLRAGYAPETAGTARVLHEALDLALAIANGPEELVRTTNRLHRNAYGGDSGLVIRPVVPSVTVL